ncbi:hypothetical protein H4R21_000780 [Coemansia helicoidea]|uniref:Uncharacterized protein n=1 Tax=Coemansia helicoidea TaxID=1286919 RepID=A0ACC1LEK6_9FUNG|nr:hypothetical protein H4R21_000780 [Coemansia helicoidea]
MSTAVDTVAGVELLQADMCIAAPAEILDPSRDYRFVDYRHNVVAADAADTPPIVKEIVAGLYTPRRLPGRSETRYRSLPLVLLYDNVGLDLFDRITYLPEYYLTNCEIDILRTQTDDIVAQIPDGSDVIELGCGSLRKTAILLEALNRQRTDVAYYAIDVMPDPLHESISQLVPKFPNIAFVGLCGMYEEVLPRLRESPRQKTVLWLGSSVGNYDADEVVQFLEQLSSSFLASDDAILIGMDKQKDRQVILDAYCDSQGVTAEFAFNVLAHTSTVINDYACRLRGSGPSTDCSPSAVFDREQFAYVNTYDDEIGGHKIFLEARDDVTVRWPREIAEWISDTYGDAAGDGLVIKRGERIFVEPSYKFSDSAAEVLGRRAGLELSAKWTDRQEYHMLNLFRKPRAAYAPYPAADPIHFDAWSAPARCAAALAELPPIATAPHQFPTLPTIDEWRQLWAVWDLLSCHVVPRDRLEERPIALRNPLIFYLGHISAFADIHMAAAESAPLTAPAVYAQWFERGIDPNMEDPTMCHDHSELPDQWPAVDEILAYRDRVRVRVSAWVDVFGQPGSAVSYDAARHVFMAFEHEAQHIETFMFMVLQMDPADIRAPIAHPFVPKSCAQPHTSWISYAGRDNVVLGLPSDDEAALAAQPLPAGHVFGWDNESPPMAVSVGPFRIRTQPITNGEYLAFLKELGADSDPAGSLVPRSWIRLGDSYGVRTLVGTPSISATEAALWPAFVSLAQAEAYAARHGKRVPTEAEWVHASRTYYLARALSASHGGPSFSSEANVDDYLDELLAARGTTADEHVSRPYNLFVPDDANIGFAHWHPQPVPSAPPGPSQPGAMPDAMFVGNAWELTSTPFHPHPGFRASPMYPGYSADFFDPPEAAGQNSTHYVLKGGSYAVHPRIAHRPTFRNWVQRGYPFFTTMFRLCESIPQPDAS